MDLARAQERRVCVCANGVTLKSVRMRHVNNHLIIYTDRWVDAYMTRNAVSEPETTRLTVTWSKEADHALRTFLGTHEEG